MRPKGDCRFTVQSMRIRTSGAIFQLADLNTCGPAQLKKLTRLMLPPSSLRIGAQSCGMKDLRTLRKPMTVDHNLTEDPGQLGSVLL